MLMMMIKNIKTDMNRSNSHDKHTDIDLARHRTATRPRFPAFGEQGHRQETPDRVFLFSTTADMKSILTSPQNRLQPPTPQPMITPFPLSNPLHGYRNPPLLCNPLSCTIIPPFLSFHTLLVLLLSHRRPLPCYLLHSLLETQLGICLSPAPIDYLRPTSIKTLLTPFSTPF